MISDLSVFKESLICVNIPAVDCGPLTPPMNGSSVGNDTTFPSITIFKCDAGFDLIGSLSRRCMANKTWSGTMPFCKGRISVLVLV